MIEKKIHYVWFGGEKPEKVRKCIESWKKYLPDYEIFEWNEKTYNVKERNKFFQKCYHRKLWAFVADYIRIDVLYHYGGIYLDTDMEIIKDITPLLDIDLFLGYENEEKMSFGILGVVPKHELFKELYEFYQKEIWKSSSYVITDILTQIMERKYGKDINEYYKKGIIVYPKEYFYPFYYDEIFKEECITTNTYGIHWWGKSWFENPQVYFLKYKHLPPCRRYLKLGRKFLRFYLKKILTAKR